MSMGSRWAFAPEFTPWWAFAPEFTPWWAFAHGSTPQLSQTSFSNLLQGPLPMQWIPPHVAPQEDNGDTNQ